jgi:hypothetical protein
MIGALTKPFLATNWFMKTSGSRQIFQWLTTVVFIALGSILFSPTASAQPINYALNKPATASGVFGGYAIANGNDGNVNNLWNGGNADSWWQVDMGSSFNINQIIINGMDGPGLHTTFQLSSSLDNINWTPVGAQTTGSGATWTFTFSTGSTQMRYIKYTTINTEGGNGSDWGTLAELQAIGDTGATTSIPTLSEWGLIILAGLLALSGMKQVTLARRR